MSVYVHTWAHGLTDSFQHTQEADCELGDFADFVKVLKTGQVHGNFLLLSGLLFSSQIQTFKSLH